MRSTEAGSRAACSRSPATWIASRAACRAAIEPCVRLSRCRANSMESMSRCRRSIDPRSCILARPSRTVTAQSSPAMLPYSIRTWSPTARSASSIDSTGESSEALLRRLCSRIRRSMSSRRDSSAGSTRPSPAVSRTCCATVRNSVSIAASSASSGAWALGSKAIMPRADSIRARRSRGRRSVTAIRAPSSANASPCAAAWARSSSAPRVAWLSHSVRRPRVTDRRAARRSPSASASNAVARWAAAMSAAGRRS